MGPAGCRDPSQSPKYPILLRHHIWPRLGECFLAAIVGHDAELLHRELDRLESLAVVKAPAKLDARFNNGTGRVIVYGASDRSGKSKNSEGCVKFL